MAHRLHTVCRLALCRSVLSRSAATIGLITLLGGAGSIAPAFASEVVTAAAPHAVAVTIYRDPERGADDALDRDFPRGFALITEKRRVTLPKGEATVRFDGVTEGMVAVSALVSGLPHKVEEQNRNASLLSPASLVDGTLGNRVTIIRSSPATGVQSSESAIVRTRADGGLVLQTANGFEAVRCSGLPEKLSFDRVPEGLSAQPVYSITTQGDGGTYEVVLTYLSWGFDWQAHHVARIHDRQDKGDTRFGLTSWLTLVNSNAQSFANAELLVIAGTLNVDSDYQKLASPPRAPALQLECYPFGSTAQGSPESFPAPPPIMMAMPAAPVAAMVIARGTMAEADIGMVAVEESLGDLKLFRVPEPVTVAAKSQKQVAFLLRDQARGTAAYEASCTPHHRLASPIAMGLVLGSVNDARHGLDASLPMGKVTVFESGADGDLLLAEDSVADTAKGRPLQIALGQSTRVQAQCTAEHDERRDRYKMRAAITNSKDEAIQVRVALGRPSQWRISGLGNTRLKDGETVHEMVLAPHTSQTVTWDVIPASQRK